MKKRFYLLGMLVAGLTFAGCTDDIDERGDNSNPQIGNAYVKVTLNLPTATGAATRAANDDYADGESNEYAVKKAALIFFTGTDERNATVAGVKELDFNSWNDNDVDNDAITSFKEFLVEVEKPEGGDKLFALAVLNATVAWTNTNATINGTSISSLKDLMMKDANAMLKTYASGTNGFLMLNAPLASATASNSPKATITAGDMTTLVELNTFDDANEAATRPADEIYVERAVAKVTVAKGTNWTETDGTYSMTVDNGGAYDDDKAILKGWYLNITNKSTKLGHDIYGVTGDVLGTAYVTWAGYENAGTNTNNQRFYSATNPRRAYWGIDCNYDNLYSGGDFLTQAEADFNIVKTPTTYEQISADLKPANGLLSDANGVYPVYCFENTMNYDKQAQIQTTGIVFVMQYMFDPNRGVETFFTLPTADKAESTLPIYTLGTVATQSTGLADKVNGLLTSASANFTVALKAEAGNLSSGYYRGAGGMKQIFTKNDTQELSEDEALQLYNVVGDVALYQNGTTYYYASRIQHFGDEYCYINPAEVDNLRKYETSHLGRYGVLRNNWYEIEVTGISGPGSPVPPVPEGPEIPDDEEKSYIKANINILSWAKRQQDVEL